MRELKFTLIADGSSDKTLLHIIKWTMDCMYPKLPSKACFADFTRLQDPPKTLQEKVCDAERLYPFDILFIHRDAESTDVIKIEQRFSQINKGLSAGVAIKTVPIVPIKMMESWFLFDIDAIKRAAGNRNYSGKIHLPSISITEKEQQPKDLLHAILREASGLKGRSLDKFNVNKAVHLVAENITDFSPLRDLKAFKRFEDSLKQAVDVYLKNNSIQL